MKTFLLLLSMSLAAVIFCAAETLDISNYQVIIDRLPFGSVSASGAVEMQPKFSEHLQLVAIVVSNSGEGPVQAVIYDKDANRSYFKTEGEMIDANTKVVHIEAQPPTPKVVLVSLLETATLTFQERQSAPAVTAPGAPRMAPGVQPPAPLPGQQPRRIPFRPR